jgi:hypothetical protein
MTMTVFVAGTSAPVARTQTDLSVSTAATSLTE